VACLSACPQAQKLRTASEALRDVGGYSVVSSARVSLSEDLVRPSPRALVACCQASGAGGS